MHEDFLRFRDRYEELALTSAQPEVIADQPRFQALMKEMATLQPMVEVLAEYEALNEEITGAREMLKDAALADLAQEELSTLEPRMEALNHRMRLMLLPKDEDDQRDVVMEIRAGAGGDEAALFGAALLRMYLRFAEREGFSSQLLSVSDNDLGGVKEAVFTVKGQGAFSRLKFESGVHRVQRVPTTESAGRIHTSTATVAVLPSYDEVEVDINPQDLRVDVFRSSGQGGQHVNTTDSAVRITHLPTGLVVSCQNEKSQIKNREQAMKVLKSRLYDKARQEKDEEYSKKRRGQVGSGDRSERIRTYNFPQGRVTDHRIGLTLYAIDLIMDGDLHTLVDALLTEAQKEALLQTDQAS